MRPVAFHLQLTDIPYWATQYATKDLESDEKAFAAGSRIRGGDYTRSNLEEIVGWKSERRLGLVGENSDSEIADALRLALCAEQPRSALAVLTGLCGVGTPMASAILTALDQEKYTVIDFRALEALGVADADPNLEFYVRHYLPECKRLALEAAFRCGLWIAPCGRGQRRKQRPVTRDTAAFLRECLRRFRQSFRATGARSRYGVMGSVAVLQRDRRSSVG
jgi:hypothetical protein